MEKERLNKYLAACGVCSRRDADKLIGNGKVTVNGEVASMGTRVCGCDRIAVNGKLLRGKAAKGVFAYFKPVSDMGKFPVRVTYAGRIVNDSEGLFLLTNDGDLIDAMMRGSAGHEKEYIVKVNKEVTEEFLARMEAGVFLKELNLTTRPCKAEKIGKFTFRIILTQGVNRQIRRMAGELSYHVNAIKRVRVVNIELANLKPGEFRQVKNDELQVLYNSCSVNKN